MTNKNKRSGKLLRDSKKDTAKNQLHEDREDAEFNRGEKRGVNKVAEKRRKSEEEQDIQTGRSWE